MLTRRFAWISLSLAATVLAACGVAQAPLPAVGSANRVAPTATAASVSATELMVTVKGKQDLANLKTMGQKLGFTVTHSWPQINAAAIEVTKGAIDDIRSALTSRSAGAGVLSAKPAGRVVLEGEPNDPMYADQYGMKLMNVAKAWEIEPGKRTTVVAMIDTGADLTHPDLKDKFVAGYNAVDKGQPPQDDAGHGTHTAGIVAAAANNGTGVIGVGGNVSIMPVKVLSKGSGSEAGIADGIIWAADHGANVASMSIGLYQRSEVLEKALQYALDKGVTLVASAGNNNAENDPTTAPHLPSTHPGVIEVAATDATNQKARFSNFGKTVSVAAPGVDVLSTWMGGGYRKASGTSMACPHVAGLAALVISQNPGMKPADVKKRIEATAQDFGTAGFDPIFGFGRVDALSAVTKTRR
jgi:subtilisin family serine protease